jgi:hypothetical protein
MLNVNKEFSDAHKKNPQRRNIWEINWEDIRHG